MTIDVPSVVGITVYFVSSLSGIGIVKFLNYNYCFTSWRVFALLSRSTWVLSLVLHGILQWREGDGLRHCLAFSRRQLCLYLLVAVVLSIVELLNAFSMSTLPGSMYMLLKGSDVGWSMSLSYIMLRNKRYSGEQIVAACLIMLGIALVFGFDIIYQRPQDKHQIGGNEVFSVASAALLCLLGAFLNALCSVSTELLLKKTLQEEQDKLLQGRAPPSKLLLSNSYSMWTSFFSFSLLAIPILVKQATSEEEDDSKFLSISATCEPTMINGTTTAADTDGPPATLSFTVSIGIAVCLALLGVSRFMERLCKYFICVYDSAVTFSIVQAARRWLGIYILGILFQEGFATGMVVGSLVSGIGFLLHSRSSSNNNNNKAASEKQYAYQTVASLDSKEGTIADGVQLMEAPRATIT